MDVVEKHFNELAGGYEAWKDKAWYYPPRSWKVYGLNLFFSPTGPRGGLSFISDWMNRVYPRSGLWARLCLIQAIAFRKKD